MADTLTAPPPPDLAQPERDTARWSRRQRRPSGTPPPLPRHIGASGALWLGLATVVGIFSILLLKLDPVLVAAERVDAWWLRALAQLRVGWLVSAADAIKIAGSGWAITGLGLAAVAALMVFRRWRHLLIFLGSVYAVHLAVAALYELLRRPRPLGVSIVGGWGGFSIPSAPVAALSAILVGMAYSLVVPGRPRTWAKLATALVVVVFALARQYLGVDHAGDALYAIALGVAIPIIAFRLLAPNQVTPVAYRKGRTAHLDVTGRRGEAIRRAVGDQLGLRVLETKPVGLEGSAGSTPLRLKVQGGPDTYVFAKLYAKSHVRADRWYKLWRTILYGTLEDEAAFQTVRRFVEYEDYTLRLLTDAGIPVPAPYGIVEITPEREYMIVMEFFTGAREIGEAVVDQGVIDQGLRLVRRLWDAGVAHRDIKPANLMVRDGKLLLIDVFFVQVRPSPWRQAVDLANMMLVLACRSDPDLVYRRALTLFTPDEIAEAFAATRGVASPTQLRAFMKRDPRDLLARFRSLAPPRRPVAIQRWNARRIALAAGMLLAFAVAGIGGLTTLLPRQNLPIPGPPECQVNSATILAAQAVPSAAVVPCLASLPSGWRYAGGDIHTGSARFWLDSDRAGRRAVLVTLADRCEVSGAQPVPSDEAGTTRYEQPLSLTPRFTDVRSYLFPGGCVTYRFAFAPGAPSTLVFAVDAGVSFVPRTQLAAVIRDYEGLTLCGRGARCPG
jgi:tRNA A-37 threonylcarbamoyl transferase component Bud32